MITEPSRKVAIIVPTFNRIKTTLGFIECLSKSNVDYTLYLCDSNSSDGTQESVASRENVLLVKCGNNAWWSEAVNAGIASALSAHHDKVIIMNDDILFGEDLVQVLLDAHARHPQNIITPFQLTDSGTFVGTLYTGVFKQAHHLASAPSDSLVDTSNGCCLLIPKVVFEKVGIIDSHNCPHLYGDTEFQLRAKNAGHKTYVEPNAKIRQACRTNYICRSADYSVFNHKGSPLNLRAYATFGKSLYGTYGGFFLLGWAYHYGFIKVLAKIWKHRLTLRLSSGI